MTFKGQMHGGSLILLKLHGVHSSRNFAELHRTMFHHCNYSSLSIRGRSSKRASGEMALHQGQPDGVAPMFR